MREPYLTCCKGHNTPVSEVLNFLICLFILHCKHLNNPYIEAFREVDSDLRFVQGVFYAHYICLCSCAHDAREDQAVSMHPHNKFVNDLCTRNNSM